MKNAETIYEVAITIDNSKAGQLELFYGLLLQLGVKPDQITESSIDNETRLVVYFDNKKQAFLAKQALLGRYVKKNQFKFSSLKRQNWQDIWKKEFKPFKISDSYHIVPAWLKGKAKKKNPIYIDTSTAFGTGMHATTRFMVQFVDQCKGKFSRFLDIGTGTGILAIAAFKSGATDITAIDIIDESMKVARNNFRENSVCCAVLKKSDIKQYHSREKFDFVAANLVTHDLIRLKRKIVSLVKPEKYLAVSGVSVKNYKLFRQHFNLMPLRCLSVKKENGWVGLLYKRS